MLKDQTGNYTLWLREAIERDVREIADERFFRTDAEVDVEVDRRLSGIAYTQRVIEELRKRASGMKTTMSLERASKL